MKQESITQALNNIETVIQSKGQPVFYTGRHYGIGTQFVYAAFLFVDPDFSGRIVDVETAIEIIEKDIPCPEPLNIGIGYVNITQHVHQQGRHYFRGQVGTLPETSVMKQIDEKSMINDYSTKKPFSWLMKKSHAFIEVYEVDYIIYLLMKHPTLRNHCLDMVVYQLQKLLKQPESFMGELSSRIKTTPIQSPTLQ